MWSSFLDKYSEVLGLVVFMALFPYVFWFDARLSNLEISGQVDRIPRCLRWFLQINPEFASRRMERGEIPSSKKWIAIVLGIGSILPIVYLVRGTDPLRHRIVVVGASVVLFFLAVALLEWLVRPRASRGQ